MMEGALTAFCLTEPGAVWEAHCILPGYTVYTGRYGSYVRDSPPALPKSGQ